MFILCQFYHIRWYIFTIVIAKKKGKKLLMCKPCNKTKIHSFTYRCSALLGYHDILWNDFITWGYHDILWNGFICRGYHNILWNGFISWGETNPWVYNEDDPQTHKHWPSCELWYYYEYWGTMLLWQLILCV